MITARRGYEIAAALPPGVQCLGLTVFQGRVICATTDGLYELRDDKLTKVQVPK